MRTAAVFYGEVLAGILTETDEGSYEYKYDQDYINAYPSQFLTFSMPVRQQEYQDKRLFAFFEGLIPEGWLLDIASKSWKLNPSDRMGLLLACCKNCIGAVSVVALNDEV